MGSSVPGGWRGSACSGGGAAGEEEGTTRDRSILAADGRRDRGGERAGGGRRERTPSCWNEYASLGDSLSSVARSTPSPSVCRFVSMRAASCICSAAARGGGGGGGGGWVGGGGGGGRVSRRARERFAKQTLGMIGATGPRSGRIPGGRRRATDRRAAPRRDLGPGAIAGRGRRRAPRGAPGSACPAGEKKQKSFALFFRARQGRTIADTVVDPRAEGGGAEPAAPVLRGRAVHRVPDRARRDDPPLGRSMRSERPGDANPAAVSTEPTEG